MEDAPQGVVENVGDMFGVVSRRVASDLKRCKEYSKARGQATGRLETEASMTRLRMKVHLSHVSYSKAL